jgi:hypothetical protein
LLRSQSGIAHMSARLFCLGPKFFELFFLSHDCPNWFPSPSFMR